MHGSEGGQRKTYCQRQQGTNFLPYQEDKESVFNAIDTVKMCLPVFTNMIKTITIKKEKMYKSAKEGFMNATDAADWLVSKSIPFRDAHEIIGKLVLYCIENEKAIDDLTIEELKQISQIFDESIYNFISLEKCVENRKIDGGPGKEYMEKYIEQAQKQILERKL